MKLVKTLVSVAITIALAGCGKTAEEHFQQANAMIDQDKNETAIVELKNAIQIDPENKEYRLLLGKTYYNLGLMLEAEKELSNYLNQSTEKSSDAVNLWVDTLWFSQQYEKILEISQESLLTSSSYSKIIVVQALSAYLIQDENGYDSLLAQTKDIKDNYPVRLLERFEQSRIEGAKLDQESLNKALNSNSLFEMHFFGLIAENLKQYDMASKIYEKVLEIAPNLKQFHLYTSYAHFRNKDFESAGKHATEVTKISAEQPFANFVLAVLDFDQGDLDSALKKSMIAIQNGFRTRESQMIAGMSAFNIQKFEIAKRYLDPIKDDFDNSHPAIKALALTDLELTNSTENLDAIYGGSINNVSESNLILNVANELLLANDNELANKLIDKVIESKVLDESTKTKAGVLQYDNSPTAAKKTLEQTIKIYPSSKKAKLALISILLQEKNYQSAMTQVDAWLNDEPKNVEALALKGIIIFKSGDSIEANKVFEELLEIDATNKSSLLFFATKAFSNAQYQKSTTLLTTLLQNHPSYLPAANQLVINYLTTKDEDKALAFAKEFSNDFPANEFAFELLLKVHFYKRNYSEIQTLVANSVIPKNNWTELTWSHYINSLVKKGLSDEALQEALQAISFNPNSKPLILQSLALARSLNETDILLNISKHSLTIHNNSLEINLAHAEALFDKGRHIQVIEKFESLSKLNAKSEPIWTTLGQAYLLNGDWEKAHQSLQKSNSISSNYKNIALLYATKKQMLGADGGIDFLADAIKKYKDDLVLLDFYAAEVVQHSILDAQPVYEKILEIQPDHFVALNNLAYIYLKNNNPKKAKPLAIAAHKMDKTNVNNLDTMIAISLALNENKRAEQYLSILKEVAPNHPKIKEYSSKL